MLKTIAITLASILGVCLLAFGSLALFSPVTLAKFFDDAGNRKASVFFYEKQYEKTGDILDLSVLVLKIDDNKDLAHAEKYLGKLTSHLKFSELCQTQDEFGGVLSSSEYYFGRYVCVLVSLGKVDKAITVSKAVVDKYGYTDYNPFTYAIVEKGKTFDLQTIELYSSAIESLNLNGLEEENKSKDLQELNKLKNNITL